jgi:hypothetical protein
LRVVHADAAAKSAFGFFCRFGQKKRKELTQAIPRSIIENKPTFIMKSTASKDGIFASLQTFHEPFKHYFSFFIFHFSFFSYLWAAIFFNAMQAIPASR